MNQKELKEALHYDPETGVFKWNKNTHNQLRKGDIAGTAHNGYIRIKINGRSYRAHRLAWFYVYGYWPKTIDHINRNPSDNRIKNLREANNSKNAFNSGIRCNNTSGIKGVFWNSKYEKWYAHIRKDYKGYHLGCFNTKEEAAKARQQAEEEML